ncbi:MAG: hypothetical protein ACKVS6_07465 [Planctomycetota bacterium]
MNPEVKPRIFKTAIAFLLLALVAVLARYAELQHPIGFSNRYEPLARAASAAQNFEIRGFLASGGLPVAAPLPVPVDEGIVSTDAPLLAWCIYAVRKVTSLDFALCGRVVELILLMIGSWSLYSIANRRVGAAGAFVAGLYLILSPLTSLACASNVFVGFIAAVLLVNALDKYIQSRSAFALAGAVAAGCAGALADYRFIFDAAAIFAVCLLFLRRRALHPGVFVAIASPVLLCIATLAAAERLAGTFTTLREMQFWNPPVGVRLAAQTLGERIGNITHTTLRNLLPIPAILGFAITGWMMIKSGANSMAIAAVFVAVGASDAALWSEVLRDPVLQIKLIIPVALGCAAAVGWVQHHWRIGAFLLSGFVAIYLFSQVKLDGPPRAGMLEAIGAAARARVAYGESFAIAESPGGGVAATAQRPVISGIDTMEQYGKLLLNHRNAIYPCRWFFMINPAFQTQASGHAARKNIFDALFARFESYESSSVFAFDLYQRKASSAPAPAMPLVFDAEYDYKNKSLRFWAQDTNVAPAWNIEIGGASLETLHSATIFSDRPFLILPEKLQKLEKLYIRANALTPKGEPGARYQEIVVRPRTLRKLKARTLALVPAAAGLMILFVLLTSWAWPPRERKS